MIAHGPAQHWVGGFERLEELNLAGAKITDAGLRGLARLSRLRSLDLSRTQVSAKGIRELAGLANLERLTLWHAVNIQDDAGAALASMRNLKVLDLSETRITDATLSALASARGLRQIYLSGTTATPEGVQAFQRTHPECQVSWR